MTFLSFGREVCAQAPLHEYYKNVMVLQMALLTVLLVYMITKVMVFVLMVATEAPLI